MTHRAYRLAMQRIASGNIDKQPLQASHMRLRDHDFLMLFYLKVPRYHKQISTGISNEHRLVSLLQLIIVTA